MAFRQDWTAGNISPVMQSALYYQGSPNLDAATSEYPYVYGTEKVEVVGDKLGGFGAASDWIDAGVLLKLPTPQETELARITVPITYSAASIAQVFVSAGGTSLINVFKRGVPTTIFSGVTALNAFLYYSAGQYGLQIGYRLTTDGLLHTADTGLGVDPPVAGIRDVWALAWQCASDGTGSATLYRNGIVALAVTGINLTLKGDTGVGPANSFEFVSVGWEAFPGGEGMPGYLDPIEVTADAIDVPLPNNSTECCGTAGSPGSGGVQNGAGVPKATLPAVPRWTPRCPGGGLQSDATAEAEGESWWPQAPHEWEAWVDLTARKFPAALGTVEHHWSNKGLPHPASYFGGPKLGRVKRDGFGDVTRTMSSLGASYDIDSWTLVQTDADGLIAGLLEDEATKIEQRWSVALRAISRSGRLAASTPRTLFRGVTVTADDTTERNAQIDCKDLLGGDPRGMDLDRPFAVPTLGDDWKPEFATSTVRPECPEALRKEMGSIVVGENSDHDTVDDAGESFEKGLVPLRGSVGKALVSAGIPGTAGTAPVYVNPPKNLTLVRHGSGPNHTVRAGVTAVTKYGETTLSNIVTMTDYPELDFSDRTANHATSPRRVDWTWDAPDNCDGVEIIGYRIYVIDDTTTGTPKYRADMNYNPAGNASTSYSDDGDDPHFKQMYPPPPTKNTAQATAGTSGTPGSGPMWWDIFVVAIGVIDWDCGDFDLYGSNADPGAESKRALIPETAFGKNASFLRPTDADWPFADPWIEVNGQRYSCVLGRGELAQAHIDGRVQLAANCPGYPTNPDGTGDLIDQAFPGVRFVLEQWSGIDSGEIYRNGATWRAPAEFADGTVKLDHAAFTAAQAESALRLGTTKGYLTRFVLTKPPTLRQFLQDASTSFGCYWRKTSLGQLGPILIRHDPAWAADAPLLRDKLEIRRWLKPKKDPLVYTRVNAQWDYDAEMQQYRTQVRPFDNLDAQDAYDGKRENQSVISLRLTGDEATATDVVLHYLDLFSKPRRWVSWEMGLEGAALELGRPYQVQSYADTTVGAAPRAVVLWQMKVSIASETVTCMALDLSRLTADDEDISMIIPSRFTVDLGGSEIAAIAGTSYARIPGAKPFFLEAADWVGYDLSLVLTRWTDDAGNAIRVALVEATNPANVIAQMAATAADVTPTDDFAVSVTPPSVGINVVLAAKMAADVPVGHAYGGLLAVKT